MEEVTLERVNENVEMLKQAIDAMQIKLDILVDESMEIEQISEEELSDEDLKLLEESRREKAEGKLISHEDLKAELGL